jgi:hypothetical protein
VEAISFCYRGQRLTTADLTDLATLSFDRRRRVRREVADIEHGPEQFGLGQDRLRPRNRVRGQVFAALDVIVQQGLDLCHALKIAPRIFKGVQITGGVLMVGGALLFVLLTVIFTLENARIVTPSTLAALSHKTPISPCTARAHPAARFAAQR